MRFVIPTKLPDISIEDAIERHHKFLEREFAKTFEADTQEITAQDISNWLLKSYSLTPWVATIGAVVRTSISKAADELQVTLPARNSNMFEEYLAQSVRTWILAEFKLQRCRRIEPRGRPLRISYTNYGAAVGPQGRVIKSVFKNCARLVWSVDNQHVLDGVFEFWVPEKAWSSAMEEDAMKAYSEIELRANAR